MSDSSAPEWLQCVIDYEVADIVDMTPAFKEWLKPHSEQQQKAFLRYLFAWTVLAVEVNALLDVRATADSHLFESLDAAIVARKVQMHGNIRHLDFNGNCPEAFHFYVFGKRVTTALRTVARDAPPPEHPNCDSFYEYVPSLEHVDPFVSSTVRTTMEHHVWNRDMYNVSVPPNWEEPRTRAVRTRVAWEPVVCAVAIVLCLFVLFVLWGLTREQ